MYKIHEVVELGIQNILNKGKPQEFSIDDMVNNAETKSNYTFKKTIFSKMTDESK